MEGTPHTELGDSLSPTDFQRLGSAAVQYEIPFASELSSNLRAAYEFLMLHGVDHEAVRKSLNLETTEQVATIEADLTARAFRRLTRISNMTPGVKEALESWAADREARRRLEESQKAEEAAEDIGSAITEVASTSADEPAETPTRSGSGRGGRSRSASRPSRKVASASASKPQKKRTKAQPQVQRKPKASPKTKPPKPLSNREVLRNMGDTLAAEGRDPLTLLQADWAMQRAFWLLTTTDEPLVKIRSSIRSSLNRQGQMGAFIEEIIGTLRLAAPDIFGSTTSPNQSLPRPTLDDRWVQGEKHALIGLFATRSTELGVDIDEMFSEAPQTYWNFRVLSVPDISFSEARIRLGTTIPYLSHAINTLVGRFATVLSEDTLHHLRYDVRRTLAQRPPSEPAAPTVTFPWREAILQMHDILKAHNEDPVALLSPHPELQQFYPLLVDKERTSEFIMAQTGINFSKLDAVEVTIQNFLLQLAPRILGFSPPVSGVDELRQSLAEQDWRWGERRFVIPAINDALTRHRILAQNYLSGNNLSIFQALADPELSTHEALDTGYNVTAVINQLIESLMDRVPPGVLEIAELRKTALELYEKQKALPRDSDEELVGDCAAGRVAFRLMEQLNINLNTLTITFAPKLGLHKKTLRKFFQGESYSHPDKTLIPLLEAAGIEDSERQQLIDQYQIERKRHDGRSRGSAGI